MCKGPGLFLFTTENTEDTEVSQRPLWHEVKKRPARRAIPFSVSISVRSVFSVVREDLLTRLAARATLTLPPSPRLRRAPPSPTGVGEGLQDKTMWASDSRVFGGEGWKCGRGTES